MVEFADTLCADDVLQKKACSMGNIDIIMSARTTEVIGDGSKVVGMTNEDRTTGEIGASGGGRHLRPDRPGAEHRVPSRGAKRP